MAPRRVEEVFKRPAAIVQLCISGVTIRTTGEHPFYTQGKGWTPAALLTSGELLRSHDGRWIPLEAMEATGEETTVYNLRIEEYHTYFVGSPTWGFSVWSHNTSCDARELAKDLEKEFGPRPEGHQAGHVVPTGAFTGRSPAVQKAIARAKRALKFAEIGLNTAKNGFWAEVGHNGTHTDKFFLTLGKELGDARKIGKEAVATTLESIRQRAKDGAFLKSSS